MSDEGQQEPSMEDILASIRKILSEDEEEGGEGGAAEAAPDEAPEVSAAPEPEPEPEHVHEPEEDDGPDLAALLAESDEEDEAAFAEPEPETPPAALELTDEMLAGGEEESYAEPEPAPAPAPQAPVMEQPAYQPPPPQQQPEQQYQPYGTEGLVADQVEQVAGVHIAQLAQAVAQERALTLGNQGITIEQLVREICTPILKQWLDHNLPYMVERVVRQEIERIVSRSERM